MENVTLALSEAYALSREVLCKNGFSAEHADAIARNVTAGERDGCASHGLWRLLGIVDTLRKGKVSADARPVITDQAPAIVKADAGGAFSLVAYEQALPLLICKAKTCGIAALAINRCVHFSALVRRYRTAHRRRAGRLRLYAKPCLGRAGWRYASVVWYEPHRLWLAAKRQAAVYFRYGDQRGGAW